MPVPFKKGNQFWKFRTTHGAGKAFKTPEILWDAAVEYFQWVDDNPLWEQRLVTYLGSYRRVDVPKKRMMTIEGLCIFLGVTSVTWRNYRNYEGYGNVCTAIEEIIFNQAIEGAAANQLNQLIVARKLGLKEKSEMSGPEGGPIVTRSINKDEYAKIRQQMLKDDDV